MIMGRRDLLTEEERCTLFGVPDEYDALVRLYTLSRADLDLVLARRGDANCLGFAVQLALLRHPGTGLVAVGDAPASLVTFMARQLDLSPSCFAEYGHRAQTATDHGRALMTRLGLRPASDTDLPDMIEAAAQAAWATDNGGAIAVAMTEMLRARGLVLPTPARIERIGIAGRARARKRTHEALVAGIGAERAAKLDALLLVTPTTGVTPLAWLRDLATAPKADNVRGLIERLRYVRDIGLDPRAGECSPPSRPVENSCGWQPLCEFGLEELPQLLHCVPVIDVLDGTVLRVLLSATRCSHVEIRTRIPALQRGLGTRREAMRDELDRQIGIRRSVERRCDVGEEASISLAPAVGGNDRRNRQADQIPRVRHPPHCGQTRGHRAGSAFVPTEDGRIDRDAHPCSPPVIDVEERLDGVKLGGEAQLRVCLPLAEIGDRR